MRHFTQTTDRRCDIGSNPGLHFLPNKEFKFDLNINLECNVVNDKLEGTNLSLIIGRLNLISHEI